ncbi:Ltp family lipoprotein [Nocardia cyriacigeorgica]|uniref:Ltp family lipoprotein n=1 Tax=Nocardia cyriacigeorgica TaxID=135487 RepID=UPI0018950FD4|nr:Ltp family lipoprotein [Nocardia cyriacigeorgica]MBF6427834.1 Ltp family lipoprotein [Nocardia cyriacigeorgica]
MTEPFPAQQPTDLPAATVPKKQTKWAWVAGAIVLVPALATAFGAGGAATASVPTPTSQGTVAVVSAPAAQTTAAWNSAPASDGGALVAAGAPAPALAAAFIPAKQLSPGQRNAVQAAEQYLELSAFSRSGLIDQLEYEGYSTEDATFAVDSLNVDWNEQAKRSAEQYLELTSFSLSALIDQLVYEGFTREQAEYGANAAY